MSVLSEHHKVLTDGVGKCSKPMWSGMGGDAGFCDADAYGEQTAEFIRREKALGRNTYVPALACPAHGGPEAGDFEESPTGKPLQPCCGRTQANCECPEPRAVTFYEWDALDREGRRPVFPRPPGPTREGSRNCESRSIASGGTREYCTCDRCF
jgi:hypothetical protein